jgi:hypothetical protein
MRDDFKSALIEEMKRIGAYDVGIAGPHTGFEFAPPHRHPLDIMPDCKSVVAFIIPRPVVLGSWYMALNRSRPE